MGQPFLYHRTCMALFPHLTNGVGDLVARYCNKNRTVYPEIPGQTAQLLS
jgi:hypothetical protein